MSQEIGGYLTRKLAEKNLSQIDFSKKTGLSASFISRLVSGERGVNRPSLDTFQKLAQGLDVPLRELLMHSGWAFDDLLPNDLDEDIRIIARDLQNLPDDKKQLAKALIKNLSETADKALK